MLNSEVRLITSLRYTTVTLCEEIETSKMYNMHKKCSIIKNITVTLCEIHLRCIICIRSV